MFSKQNAICYSFKEVSVANIRQVAKAAGVSPATVSRVLSGDPGFNVKEETRIKIMEAVAELKYEFPIREPDQYRFGCVLAYTTDKYADPFFMEILESMERECRKYNATIAVTKSYKELETPKILQEFLGADLDGVFLMEHVSPEVMTVLKTHVKKIIFIDNDEPEYFFNNVGFDHTTANWQAMSALIDRGYKRIALISGSSPGMPLSDTIRLVTYRETLRRAGIKYDKKLIKDCGWDMELCKKQTEELMAMEEPPDAIFAGSDSLASVVLGTLYAMGKRCPRDVGVIGFNNIDLSSHMVPPLTTIEVPTTDIGKAAVERMIQIITTKDKSIRRILFPTELIERKSLR